MHVVTVELRIAPDHVPAFERAMLANAHASRDRESGCRQFDVCVDRADQRYFLYELYDDEAAFQAHLQSPHFMAFDRAISPWVIDKKVRSWHRLAP